MHLGLSPCSNIAGWEAALLKRCWVSLGDSKLKQNQTVCPGSNRGYQHPAVHQQQRSQSAERSDDCCLFSTHLTTSRQLHTIFTPFNTRKMPTSWSQVQHRTSKTVSTREDRVSKKRLRQMGLFQFRKGKALWDLIAIFLSHM